MNPAVFCHVIKVQNMVINTSFPVRFGVDGDS
jgi:hypothetical protein|eukprot:COSAG02_NODE_4430_length_5367_cov_3.587699_2_plen_32_part_00